MAKGTKTGGKDFEIGHHIGRPKMPEEIKELAKFSRTEISAAFAKFLSLNIHELEKILTDKSLTVIDHWVGRIALMGIKNGDPIRLQWLLTVVFGKVINEQPKLLNDVDDPELLREIPSDVIRDLIRNRLNNNNREN